MTPSSHTFLALLVASALGGCVATTPETDRNFGSSVRSAVVLQTADPAAAANTTPVTGLDGRAAKASMDHYETTFRKPPEPQSSLTTGSGK